MRIRGVVLAGVIGVMLFGLSAQAPAQTLRVIPVTMTSYAFDPSLLTFHEGERVVLELSNIDPQPRAHNVASAYLGTVEMTLSGDVREGVTRDGLKYALVERGKKGRVAFTVRGRGQWSFICSLFNHAAQGEVGAIIVWPAGYRTKP